MFALAKRASLRLHRGSARLQAAACFVALCAAVSAPALAQTSRPATDLLEEARFREGLRERGLTQWLEQYLQDQPPLDAADAAVRRREALLAEARNPGLAPCERRAKVSAACDLIVKLLADHPKHPARLQWRFELARDLIERVEPAPFDSLLLYDLPGRDRARVLELSARALAELRKLREDIAAEWRAHESLDEAALERLTAEGAFRSLESLDAGSALLHGWARLYHGMASEPGPARDRELASLLADVEARGWMQLPVGQEAPRCGALLIAAICARVTGKFDEASQLAGQVSGVIKAAAPASRERLRKLALLCVIEQIRNLRDSGKSSDALASVDQANAWAKRARADDLEATIAIALAEQSLLAGASSTRPALPAGFLQPEEALEPLKRLSGGAPAQRDALYAALAGALRGEPFASKNLHAQQLLAGAAVADPDAQGPCRDSATEQRLAQVCAMLKPTIAALPPGTPDSTRGELFYLLGRASQLCGRRADAVGTLADLVERLPQHDRASAAADQAAAAASEWLQAARPDELPAARKAFIRAASLLVKRTGEPVAARLRYPIALALEQDGQFEAAAEAYAAVPGDDPSSLKAALGKARALRNALAQAAGTPRAEELARRALAAAQEGVSKATATTSAPAEQRCLAAEIVLNLAGLLNSTRKPDSAFAALDGFERRFAACPGALGPALRERTLALRQLNRLTEARHVIEQFLQADPDNAGPAMASLLEAMRKEIHAAAEAGRADTVVSIAAEAAALAQRLIEWAGAHHGRVRPMEEATIRIWLAWSLLDAGRHAEAQPIFEACCRISPEILPLDSAARLEAQLGRAECLLAANKPAEALPLFSGIWQNAPEHSAHWWQAFVGQLECHTRLNGDPQQILQSIRQQRRLAPDLGARRWKRALEAIEARLNAPTSLPAQ